MSKKDLSKAEKIYITIALAVCVVEHSRFASAPVKHDVSDVQIETMGDHNQAILQMCKLFVRNDQVNPHFAHSKLAILFDLSIYEKNPYLGLLKEMIFECESVQSEQQQDSFGGHLTNRTVQMLMREIQNQKFENLITILRDLQTVTVGTNEKFMVSIIESHHRAILEICSLPEVNFVNHVEIYERLSALAWLLRRGLQQIIQKYLLSRKQCIDEWVMRILGMSILASLITEQPMLHFLSCAS